MKPHLLSFAVIAVAVSMAACRDEVVAPPDQPGDTTTQAIIPLAVGNMWVGRVTGYDAKGNVRFIELDTVRLVKSQTIDGVTWYVTNRDFKYAILSDGYYSWPPNTSAPFLIVRHPARLNDTFGTLPIVDFHSNDTMSIASYVAAEQDAVTVPAGTFNAIKYGKRYYDADGKLLVDGQPGMHDLFWYMPGVGHIRSDYHTRDTSGAVTLWSRWELVSTIRN